MCVFSTERASEAIRYLESVANERRVYQRPCRRARSKAFSRSLASRAQPTGPESYRGSRKRFFAPAKKGAPTPRSSSGGKAPPLSAESGRASRSGRGVQPSRYGRNGGHIGVPRAACPTVCTAVGRKAGRARYLKGMRASSTKSGVLP